MAGHAVRDCLFPDVVGEDITVYATRIDLVPCFRDGNAGDWEIGLDEIDGSFYPRIPDPHAAIIGAGDEYLFSSRRRSEAIDNLLVALVPPYSQACFEIPRRERRVCGRGEDVCGRAGPVQVEDGAFVAGQDAVVLA